MPLEENKAIIRRLFEAENKRNLTMLDELIAPDFIEGRNTPFELRGSEGYKQFVTALFKAFPDWHETIEDIIAEGDKVCVLLNATATHAGEWDFHSLAGSNPFYVLSRNREFKRRPDLGFMVARDT